MQWWCQLPERWPPWGPGGSSALRHLLVSRWGFIATGIRNLDGVYTVSRLRSYKRRSRPACRRLPRPEMTSRSRSTNSAEGTSLPSERKPRGRVRILPVDESHKREYSRVGRRKDEDADESTGESFPPWDVLDSCQLCWVRFERGALVAACDCLTEYANG